MIWTDDLAMNNWEDRGVTDEGSAEGKLAALDQVIKNGEAQAEDLLEDNKRLERERDEAQERAFHLKGKLASAHSYIAILTFALVLLVLVVAVVQWFGIPFGVAPPAM